MNRRLFKPSRKSQAADIAWLEARGWREEQIPGPLALWRWRDPKSKALYRMWDALSLERSRERAK